MQSDSPVDDFIPKQQRNKNEYKNTGGGTCERGTARPLPFVGRFTPCVFVLIYD